VRQQQLMGQQKGIVMDGRDIGTVVFPTAELKFLLPHSRKSAHADATKNWKKRYFRIFRSGIG
jgi:cytidylate kinase